MNARRSFRQGGDEFCILLPEAGPRRAARAAARIRDGLAHAVGTGMGIATFPADSGEAIELIELADARLTAEKADRRGGPRPSSTGRSLAMTPSLRALASVDTDALAATGAEASRAAIGSSRTLWRVTGTMFAFYAAAARRSRCSTRHSRRRGFARSWPSLGRSRVAIFSTPPPPQHTWRSELVVALSYVLPALLFRGRWRSASLAIGASVFIGPLLAIRTASRVRAVTHATLADGCCWRRRSS